MDSLQLTKTTCGNCGDTLFLEPGAVQELVRCRTCIEAFGAAKPGEPAVAVTPLACQACSAPVPIVDDRVAQTCVHCRADCVVPPEHQVLLRANRRSAAQEERASELYARVGDEPSGAVRVWGDFAEKLIDGVLVPFTHVFMVVSSFFIHVATGLARVHVALLIVALVPAWLLFKATAWVLQRVAPSLGFDPTAMATWALAGLVLLTLVALPSGISRYFQEFVAVRRQLRGALAATRPVLLGGGAACRSCGAALVVADGARGARCGYCRADNLLRVRERDVQRLSAHASDFGASIEDAASRLEDAHAKARAQVQRVALVSLLVEALFVMGGYAASIGLSLATFRK